jgi:Arc/MetJ-type ribon-helix-helix transcriptional regulator
MSELNPRQQSKRQRGKRKQRHERGERRRDNVVMVRVDEGDLSRIDELVASGQFNSRSEATAFLIGEGIKSKQQMFDKMAEKISQIQNLRSELEVMIAEDTASSAPVEQQVDGMTNQEGGSQ